jgi:hypothetical protein
MNIKADSTIVASAGALAKAKVPFSMEGMTDNLLKQRGELLDSISTNFEKSMQNIDGINAEAKEKLKKLAKNINDGTVNNSDERAEMQDQVEAFRQELKDIPLFGKENKRKRSDLLYKINKYTKNKQTEDQISDEIITSYTADAYDAGRTGAPAIAFLKNFADHYNGDMKELDKSFKVETVDGKRVFSFTYTDPNTQEKTDFEKQSIEDISKLLKKKDKTPIIAINKSLNDLRDYYTGEPKIGRLDGPLQHVQNDIETLLVSDPNYLSIVSRTRMFGQPMSYHEALHNPNSSQSKQIFETLYNLHPELDTAGAVRGLSKPNNVITEADFATDENYKEFVRSLTDPNPEELALACELAAKFYAESEGNNAITLGIQLRPDPKTEKASGSGDSDKGSDEDEPGRYPTNQVYTGGITGGNLNIYLDMLRSNEVELEGGVVLTRDPDTNVWSSSDGSTRMSGDNMLESFQNDLNQGYPDSGKILRSEEYFQEFKGGFPGPYSGFNTFPPNN